MDVIVAHLGPISSIKIVRYILNCAYVVFWDVRTSVSSKHLKLFVRTKICVSLKTSYFWFCLTSVSENSMWMVTCKLYIAMQSGLTQRETYVGMLRRSMCRSEWRQGVRTSLPLKITSSIGFHRYMRQFECRITNIELVIWYSKSWIKC